MALAASGERVARHLEIGGEVAAGPLIVPSIVAMPDTGTGGGGTCIALSR